MGRMASSARKVARGQGIVPLAIEIADIASDAFSPLGQARARRAISQLKRHNRTQDLDSLIDVAFSFTAAGRRLEPLQIRSEITNLLSVVSSLRPRAMLEIGTAHGGTLLLWAAVADPCATILSLDFAGYAKWMVPLFNSFARDKQRIELVQADSHELSTQKSVEGMLEGSELDFVFIDGDHSYQGVKQDFQMYCSLVRPGGLVAFHDIVRHPPSTGCEVGKFWDEIKQLYDHEELVENWGQRWGGIGILRM
jgi:predicted O-methyltransferase YrrM